MKRPGKVLRELTQSVGHLDADRMPLYAMDPRSGEMSPVDQGSPKGPLGALCAFCFLLGLALGLWTAFPQAALALLWLLGIGVLGVVWYGLCARRERSECRKDLGADESVSFWDS